MSHVSFAWCLARRSFTETSNSMESYFVRFSRHMGLRWAETPGSWSTTPRRWTTSPMCLLRRGATSKNDVKISLVAWKLSMKGTVCDRVTDFLFKNCSHFILLFSVGWGSPFKAPGSKKGWWREFKARRTGWPRRGTASTIYWSSREQVKW